MYKTLAFLITLFVFSGCQIAQRHTVSHVKPSYVETQKGVTLSARAINLSEEMDSFEKMAHEKGFQPIEIVIDNKSDGPMLYSKESLEITTVSREEIKQVISPQDKATGWTLNAFLIWPMVATAREGASDLVEGFDSFVRRIIPQNEKAKGVIFVPKNSYNGQFTLTLENSDNGDVIGFRVRGI